MYNETENGVTTHWYTNAHLLVGRTWNDHFSNYYSEALQSVIVYMMMVEPRRRLTLRNAMEEIEDAMNKIDFDMDKAVEFFKTACSQPHQAPVTAFQGTGRKRKHGAADLSEEAVEKRRRLDTRAAAASRKTHLSGGDNRTGMDPAFAATLNKKREDAFANMQKEEANRRAAALAAGTSLSVRHPPMYTTTATQNMTSWDRFGRPCLITPQGTIPMPTPNLPQQ